MKTPLKALFAIALLGTVISTNAHAVNEGMKLSCTEKSAYVENEEGDWKVISSGQRLQITKDGETYKLAQGTVEAGLKDSLFGSSLSECKVSASTAESFPVQYFLREATCVGDDRARDGALTEVSVVRVENGFEAKIKTTVNNFGAISVDEKVVQMDACGVRFED